MPDNPDVAASTVDEPHEGSPGVHGVVEKSAALQSGLSAHNHVDIVVW
jgi:hypothetical protein